MTLGRTPAGLIKTKSDGGLRAVNCACCGDECPTPIGFYQYTKVITSEQAKALRDGGNYTVVGTLQEPLTGCSFSGTDSGIFHGGTCKGSFSIVDPVACTDNFGGGNTSLGLGFQFWKDGTDYIMGYQGGGYCAKPYGGAYGYGGFCYSVGFFIADFVNISPPFEIVGVVNIHTTAGTISFNIISLFYDGFNGSSGHNSASLDITITPFTS
jgi:hypothetical protein